MIKLSQRSNNSNKPKTMEIHLSETPISRLKMQIIKARVNTSTNRLPINIIILPLNPILCSISATNTTDKTQTGIKTYLQTIPISTCTNNNLYHNSTPRTSTSTPRTSTRTSPTKTTNNSSITKTYSPQIQVKETDRKDEQIYNIY